MTRTVVKPGNERKDGETPGFGAGHRQPHTLTGESSRRTAAQVAWCLCQDEDESGPNYHMDSPDVVKGIGRSVCRGSALGYWHVAFRARTTDEEPDPEVIQGPLSGRYSLLRIQDGGDERDIVSVLDVLPPARITFHKEEAGSYYEVSMGGVRTPQLDEAMDIVDRIGKKLLQTKEIAQGLAGDDTKALITELSRA